MVCGMIACWACLGRLRRTYADNIGMRYVSFPFCQKSRTLISGRFIFRAQRRRCVLEGFAHILYQCAECVVLS